MSVTTAQEIQLIFDETVEIRNIAKAAYETARNDLDALAAAIPALPGTLVDTTIGTDAGVTWTATWSPPSAATEPDYSATLPTAPTIAEVTIPTITVGTAPDTAIDLTGTPAALTVDTLAALPELSPLPLIEAAVPTMDVSLLESAFLWEEPVYIHQLSDETREGLRAVLAGNLGIPQSYWDSLWSQAQADLIAAARAKQRDTAVRGAAGYWQLPTETLLSANRAIEDEAARVGNEARLKQAHEQAVMAREDFWKAIEQAIGYEKLWLDAHHQAAGRSLAAAEQLHRVRVEVHNANVGRFNTLLERAKLQGSLEDLAVRRALSEHAAQLQSASMALDRVKTQVQTWQARWSAFGTEKDLSIRKVATQVQAWNGIAEAQNRGEKLRLERSSLEVQNYTAQLGAIDGIARATASMLSARVGLMQANIASATVGLEFDKAKNAAKLDVARIDNAAQEASVRFDIAQAEWMQTQAQAMLQRIAELSFGYAQAAVAASDVSYGRSVNTGISASQNEALAW